MTGEEKRAAWEAAGILGIGEGETIDGKELRRVYKEFAHTWHPDVAQKRGVSAEEANDKMAKGNHAHSVLKKAIEDGGGSYTVAKYEPAATSTTATATDNGSYGSTGTYDAGYWQSGSQYGSQYGTQSGTKRKRKKKKKKSSQGNGGARETVTNSNTNNNATNIPTQPSTSGGGDSGVSAWTFFVFAVLLCGTAIWNQYDPMAAFDFMTGFIFHPERILIVLAIAYVPRIFFE